MTSPIKNFIEETERLFDERFSYEWWKGFGTSDDIDEQGKNEIKSFLRTRQAALLDALLEELPAEREIDTALYADVEDRIKAQLQNVENSIYNSCLQEVQQKLLEIKKLLD